MASCVRCGRETPASSEAETPLCHDCRADLDPSSIATRPAPPVRISSRFLLTQAIVGINVLVFAGMLLSGVSLVAPTQLQLVIWGANFAPLSLGTQPWRILASNYVHIGIIHIFFNMWCLWNLGRLAESIFDRWTYLLIYTASGIAGSLASLWWHPQGIGAGASGAIFGLAGGLIAVLYLGKLPFAKEALKPTLRSLVMFAAYNLFFGLVPGIDNAAHLGGLATGLAIGALLAASVTEPPDIRARRRNYVVIGATALLLAGYSYVKQKSGPAASPVQTSILFVIPNEAKRSERSGGTCCRCSGDDAEQRHQPRGDSRPRLSRRIEAPLVFARNYLSSFGRLGQPGTAVPTWSVYCEAFSSSASSSLTKSAA
jgi:membrane associated rhomboid family serine protease